MKKILFLLCFMPFILEAQTIKNWRWESTVNGTDTVYVNAKTQLSGKGVYSLVWHIEIDSISGSTGGTVLFQASTASRSLFDFTDEWEKNLWYTYDTWDFTGDDDETMNIKCCIYPSRSRIVIIPTQSPQSTLVTTYHSALEN